MKFTDLHLCASLRDLGKAKELISKSHKLGYSRIGVPFPANVKQDTLDTFQRICEESGVDFVTRLDLVPQSPNELLSCLRRSRHRFEVVAVLCDSKPVARQAAKDHRVDLLCFPSYQVKKRFFDWAEAELASKSSAAVEIDMAQILCFEGSRRAAFLSSLRREMSTAKRFHVPIVFSSGADQLLNLRKPQDFASLTFLFDMNYSLALDAMSKNANAIVERNRSKLSPDFLGPGIRLISKRRIS